MRPLAAPAPVIALPASTAALAAERLDDGRRLVNVDKDGVILDGYDPAQLFNDRRAESARTSRGAGEGGLLSPRVRARGAPGAR